MVELPSQHRLVALAGGDAVDTRLWWMLPSLSSVHAETGLSQVQILPARPVACNEWLVKGKIVSFQTTNRLLIVFGQEFGFSVTDELGFDNSMCAIVNSYSSTRRISNTTGFSASGQALNITSFSSAQGNSTP